MRRPLTEQEKRAYMFDPTRCPYCGSGNVESGTPDADGGRLTMYAQCYGCDGEWDEVYQLTGVETAEEE